jgi:hypothetical protein
VEGTGSTTFFVPSNLAFKKLPWKLELFLFSPFGENVLKKLLQFHVVPGIVLHSDYLHNATSGDTVSANAWPEVFDELDAEYAGETLFQLDFDGEVDFSTIRKGRPLSYRHGDSRRTEFCPDHGSDDDRHHPLPPLLPAPGIGRGHCAFMTPSPPPPSGDHPHHPHGPPPSPPSRGSCKPYGGGRRPPRTGDHCKEHDRLLLIPHKPVFSANVTVPTLLTNHSLHVHVTKVKYRLPIPGHKREIYVTKLFVNDQNVAVSDIVSRNGAVHVINKVLNPRPRHHHRPHKDEDDFVDREDDEWEDWEDWLPQWAEEN